MCHGGNGHLPACQTALAVVSWLTITLLGPTLLYSGTSHIGDYSAVSRKYIILSPVNLCPFRVSAQDRWLSFMQTTPLNVTLQSYNWGVWLASNLLDRDNLSEENQSPAPNVSIIQRFHCTSTCTSAAVPMLWTFSLQSPTGPRPRSQ